MDSLQENNVYTIVPLPNKKKLEVNKPIVIEDDNKESIYMTKTPILKKRSKHIDIKHHFIREKYSQGHIDVQHIPTNQNLADIFTKQAVKFKIGQF